MAKRKPQMPQNTTVREDGTWGSDKNPEYDYVIRYITEAIDYRTKKVSLTARAIDAYKGIPSKDGYKRAIDAYAGLFDTTDKTRADSIRTRCKGVESKKNMIVMRAIDSMVAQAQGGVGQFECAPYDKNFEKSPELVDALDAAAMDFYTRNHVDSVLSTMLEWAGLSGAAYAYLGYDLTRPIEDGRVDMQIIPDTEMLIDPLRTKRNNPRYIGHQTKASWTELKKHLFQCPISKQWLLESINNVDVYLQEVEFWINKYNGNFSQIAPAIAADVTHFAGMPYGVWFRENLPHHIDTFYKASAEAYKERNTKYIQRAGDFPAGANDGKYHTDEVEVSYLYDLKNHIQFTVINRKFIVEAKENYLETNMEYQYFEIDDFSGKALDMTGKKKIKVDHPYVELAYKRSLWETYSYSPIIHVLDLFDDACALETMIYHTIQVMTPITFTGNPKDIEKLGAIAGVSGEAIKGFIANSVTVLNKAVDLSPAMSELSRIENTIMNVLHGVDPKEQSQMIGNRATAAEAMQAASLVSQGLNSLLANIEEWASELANKMFRLTVIYEGKDFVYDLNANGKHLTLTRKDLAGDFGVHAVLKSKIKAERQAQAANTIQWFVPLMNSDVIVNKEAFAQSVIPTLAEGFTRKTIASWFAPSDEQKMAQEAMLELQKQEAKALQHENTMKELELGYVDPTSDGKYGMADVARALSRQGIEDDVLADYSAQPSPVGGNNKPSNTSRKLGYGVGQVLPEGNLSTAATPSKYVPSSYPGQPIAVDQEAASVIPTGVSTDSSTPQGEASAATIQALMSPTTGGQYYNNAISGVNSPLTQGVVG